MEALNQETKPEDSTALTVQEMRAIRTIPDADGYQKVANAVLLLKQAIKAKQEEYEPDIKRARGVVEGLRKGLALFVEPWEAAIGYAKSLMVAFDTEQARIARQKQLELERQAKEKQEAEALEVAYELEKAGCGQEATRVLSNMEELPPVVVQKQTPKSDGISYRDVWKFEITDANQIPREYLKVDEVKIGGVVRAMKGATNISGIRVYSEKIVTAKA